MNFISEIVEIVDYHYVLLNYNKDIMKLFLKFSFSIGNILWIIINPIVLEGIENGYWKINEFSEAEITQLCKDHPENKCVEICLSKGLEFKKKGEFEAALEFWLKAREELPVVSYAIGSEFIRLATEQKLKPYYKQATGIYYWGLSGTKIIHQLDQKILEKDLLYLKILMRSHEVVQTLPVEDEKVEHLLTTVRMYWDQVDPLPTEAINPRLIEHFSRVAMAKHKFADKNSPYGFDDRGKTFIRYGEPEKRLEINLDLKTGEIYQFMSDFMFFVDNSGDPGGYSASSQNKSGISDAVNELKTQIVSNPVLSEIDIWVYNLQNQSMEYKLIQYFKRSKNNTYKKIDSIDDWFPNNLFYQNPIKAGFTGNLSPGLILQYYAYQKLSEFDSYFRDDFNEIENEIFFKSAPRSDHANRQLALKFKTENRLKAFQNESYAPAQISTELSKISPIPLEVYQYRLLDEQGNPVLATFVESRPSAAFLTDLTANQDKMVPETEHVIAEELSRWYTLRQDVDLRDESGRLTGRLRSLPELPLDEQDRVPATSLFTIPHLPEATTQHFYVTLENHHPGTKPPEESVFPDELRGLGRVQLPQPEPLDLNGEGPVLGDLLIGYGRMEHTESGLKFPFVVSHDRTIPEGENLAVHFEAYRLQTNRQGFANFEVRYEIEPRQGLIGRLLANKENLSGTLEFKPRAGRFAESLGFEDLGLEPGHYTLHWTVLDLQRGDGTKQALGFEIVGPAD